MQTGIYQIRNLANNKYYIGSSVDMSGRRRSHWCHLRANKHHGRHLQRAWNKYGEDAFEFVPLIILPIEDLETVEQEMLDRLNPPYNDTKYVGAPHRGREFSREHRHNLSVAHTGTKLPDEVKKKISIGVTKAWERGDFDDRSN